MLVSLLNKQQWLNHLQTGAGQFRWSMHSWGLSPLCGLRVWCNPTSSWTVRSPQWHGAARVNPTVVSRWQKDRPRAWGSGEANIYWVSLLTKMCDILMPDVRSQVFVNCPYCIHHETAIQMLWLHFWVAFVSSTFILTLIQTQGSWRSVLVDG